MDLFHWSPNEIDESDIETLIPLVFRYPQWKQQQKQPAAQQRQEIYVDEVDWL